MKTSLSPTRGILLGGATVAVLDISDAFVFWYLRRGVTPGQIFQSVASGLVGRAAATAGGASTMVLGAAIHVFVAFTVATVYALASRRLPALQRKPWTFGPLYGVTVYCFMYYVVMPLSQIGWPAFSWVPFLNNVLLAHVCCVGLPAALWASKIDWSRQGARTAA